MHEDASREGEIFFDPARDGDTISSGGGTITGDLFGRRKMDAPSSVLSSATVYSVAMDIRLHLYLLPGAASIPEIYNQHCHHPIVEATLRRKR